MAGKERTPQLVTKTPETRGCSDRFETVVNSISDGVFAVDTEWRITCFNSAAERTTGIPREQALGRPCREVFRSNICEEACALRFTMETGRPIVNLPVHIHDARGRRVPVTVSTALLKDKRRTASSVASRPSATSTWSRSFSQQVEADLRPGADHHPGSGASFTSSTSCRRSPRARARS